MMKICVSTLGCPSWEWSEIVSTVKDFGYNGIEVRGIGNELFVPRAKVFSEGEIDRTKQRLRALELTITCLTSGCLLHKSDKDYVSEGKAYIDLAQRLGCRYVRVLGDTNPEPSEAVDTELVRERLSELAAYGEDKGVMPLIETNGYFADSDHMRSLLEQVHMANLGVVWDIHHPYRFCGESPEQTFKTLKPYIRHVHVKDSKLVDGKLTYVMMGEGDVPVLDCARLLAESGYDGFLSLEWVKRWYENLTEPGIVFMQFADYMKGLLSKI